MEFSTQRLTAVEGTNKTEYTTNLTGQSGMIQPLGDIDELGAGNKVGQTFKLFCERVDIKVSDKIVYNEEEYVVKNVKDFNYGAFPHLEIVIVLL
jgi:hypothetical protein